MKMTASTNIYTDRDWRLLMDQSNIIAKGIRQGKQEQPTKLHDIPEFERSKRPKRTYSESDWKGRILNAQTSTRTRRSSDSEFSRRLSTLSLDSSRTRRLSTNDVMDTKASERSVRRSSSKGEVSAFYMKNPPVCKSRMLKTQSSQALQSLPKFYRTQGKGRAFRRVRSENNVIPAPWKNRILPLVRFRRAVKTIQVLLKATLTQTQGQRNDGLLSWAHDDVNTSKREYEMFGLSFDPGDFRAKREIHLSNEAKAILSMDPEQRTEEHHKVALLALNQAVEAFSEFPITMQKSLVRVGWYEHFEDKRVIIRQGHMADNFYFILSGTAIVTILQTDLESGDQVIRTAAVLKKGNSFGELALMHGARRSATVTCKDSVELLAVGRDDFIDIFMPITKDQEPEHIQFLRNIHLLKGWPIEKLPYHDPRICCFTYFRRGLLLCKDSNSSEWVYILKTGTCRVLKALHMVKPQVPGHMWSKVKTKPLLKLPPISSPQKALSTQQNSRLTPTAYLQDILNEHERKTKRCTTDNLYAILHRPYFQDDVVRETHKKLLENIYTEKHNQETKWRKKYTPRTKSNDTDYKERTLHTVYVQIQKLGPRDTYGVEQVAFGRIGQTTSTILVSEGAECILINKKYFQQYLSDEEAKRIRRTLQPIPSDESLQQKLQDKTNWEAYKAITVVSHMVHRKPFYNDATSYH